MTGVSSTKGSCSQNATYLSIPKSGSKKLVWGEEEGISPLKATYIPSVLTKPLESLSDKANCGSTAVTDSKAKSLSFTLHLPVLFPAYLPPLIYFPVEKRPHWPMEAYGWCHLLKTLGKFSPGSLNRENLPLEEEVVHAHLTEGKTQGVQEMSTRGRQTVTLDFASRPLAVLPGILMGQPSRSTETLVPLHGPGEPDLTHLPAFFLPRSNGKHCKGNRGEIRHCRDLHKVGTGRDL